MYIKVHLLWKRDSNYRYIQTLVDFVPFSVESNRWRNVLDTKLPADGIGPWRKVLPFNRHLQNMNQSELWIIMHIDEMKLLADEVIRFYGKRVSTL